MQPDIVSHMSDPPAAVSLDPALVDAAAAVLDEGGIRALTITAIAERAGVSRVTLHRRGATVEDYVVAVLVRASDDLRESLWPLMTSSEPAAARLRSALTVLCEVFERNSGIMAALFDVPTRQIPGRPGRTTSLEFVEPFAKLLADGQADGSITCGDVLEEATLTANAVVWTYLHMRRTHGWSIDDVATRVVELAIAHLLPRP